MSEQQASSSNSQNTPSSAWTEPPWSGWIETTGDALLILEAARRGLIPRVTRRLVDSERKMITSGSVFVFDEDESGIKRWTDGFFWSPSRILGNFLLYRETEKRGAGHRGRPERDTNHEEQHHSADGVKSESQSLSRPKGESSRLGIDRQRERTLVGSLTNSYKFKPGGMMKKTFSLTIGGVAQHLISYYKVEDVEQGRLRSPSSLPELASLDISPEYLDKTHFRNPPKVEIGVDGVPRYCGEADDVDNSPPLVTTAPPPALPYDELSTPSGKRTSRYGPYGQGASNAKRPRKSKVATTTPVQEPARTPTTAQPYSPSVQQPTPAYPDPSLSATTTPHYAPPYYQMHPGYSFYHPIPSPYPASGPPAASGSSPGPQQTPTPPAPSSSTQPPISYPSYAPSEGPQPVYPYYPPHAYSYPGVPWSAHYAPYPPHPHAQAQPSGAVITEIDEEEDTRGNTDRGGT